jgi:hypothetical protein
MPDINKHIKDLLSYSDSLIIPGFGKIVREYIPSVLDRTANKISPPHYKIQFDFYEQEDFSDKLLLYICEKEKLSFEAAAEMLQQYKKSLLQKIYEGEKITIPTFGTFYTEEESLKFIPEEFDLNAASIDALPLDRKIAQPEKSYKSSANKNSVLVLRIFVTLLILVGLICSMLFLFNGKNPGKELKTNVNSLDTLKKVSALKADTLKKTEAEPGSAPEKSENELEKNSYLIAVGTYEGADNSAKIEKLLKEDKYEVMTKQYKSGKIRVLVVVKGQVSDLNKALKNIRMKYDKAAFVVD